MVRTLIITLFTGTDCQVETLFSSDIIIERNIFTVLAPAANTTNIDYEPSLFFYCLQSTANNDRFRVNTQNLCSYLIKNNGQPAETRIMKGEL